MVRLFSECRNCEDETRRKRCHSKADMCRTFEVHPRTKCPAVIALPVGKKVLCKVSPSSIPGQREGGVTSRSQKRLKVIQEILGNILEVERSPTNAHNTGTRQEQEEESRVGQSRSNDYVK